MGLSTLAVGIAAVLDALVGEPPQRVHPVAWFGRLVTPLDRNWTHPRLVGGAAALVLPLVAAVLVGGPVALVATPRPLVGAVTAGLALFVTTSLRRLLTVADDVATATETDLDRARTELRALAGREASDLSPGEVRSAVIESVAENLADGLVAPLAAFAAGAAIGLRLPAFEVAGLAVAGSPAVAGSFAVAGSPAIALGLASAGATWVKAVNTMDSMLGYRSKPVGWASARLDDAVMWLPARLSAVLLAAASLAPGALGDARAGLDSVPSPNSGWPMGTVAAALGVRLVKPGSYELGPEAALPTVEDVHRARRRAVVAGGLAYVLAGVIAWG